MSRRKWIVFTVLRGVRWLIVCVILVGWSCVFVPFTVSTNRATVESSAGAPRTDTPPACIYSSFLSLSRTSPELPLPSGCSSAASSPSCSPRPSAHWPTPCHITATPTTMNTVSWLRLKASSRIGTWKLPTKALMA